MVKKARMKRRRKGGEEMELKQYKYKNSLIPSSLLIHASFLLWLAASSSAETLFIPRYPSAVACRESASLCESSTPMCNNAARSSSSLPVLLHHLQTSQCWETICQSPAYKRGRDMGLRGQPGPLCSPAHWRINLAWGAPSAAVGHPTQSGSGARPGFHPPLHPDKHL